MEYSVIVKVPNSLGERASVTPERYPGLGNCLETWRSGPGGYGTMRVNGIKRSVHRLAYLAANNLTEADIEGKVIMHKCDNRKCINPEHLTAGTQADNVQDRDSKGRTASMKGESNPGAKLTDRQIAEMRSKWKTGKYSIADLVAEYDTSRSGIGNILTGVRRREEDLISQGRL